MDRIGVEYYLPLQKIVRQWSDRRKKVKEPLFKSYLFVNIENEKERLDAVKTYGVSNYLFFNGKPAIVKDREITAIQEFLGQTEYQPEDSFEFMEGDIVKIRAGMFNGQEGEFLARQGKHLILLVESLGQVIKAEVPIVNIS